MELRHIGKKGMRWGHRKAPTPTSTTTQTPQKPPIKMDKNSLLKSGTAGQILKNKDKLSIDELNKALTRLRMEKQLKELDSSLIKSGSSKTRQILADATSKVAVATLSAAGIYIVKKALNKASKKKGGNLGDVILSPNKKK